MTFLVWAWTPKRRRKWSPKRSTQFSAIWRFSPSASKNTRRRASECYAKTQSRFITNKLNLVLSAVVVKRTSCWSLLRFFLGIGFHKKRADSVFWKLPHGSVVPFLGSTWRFARFLFDLTNHSGYSRQQSGEVQQKRIHRSDLSSTLFFDNVFFFQSCFDALEFPFVL